jgi:hypothetical protein
MPRFGFWEWLLGLMVACGLRFCLTPVAARGMRGLRPLAWICAALMFLNGLRHTLFSILGPPVAGLTFPPAAPGFLFLSLQVGSFSVADGAAAA